MALEGPTYTPEQQAEVYRRFPEWSPQRHMHMDAPQRQAVRDLPGSAAPATPCALGCNPTCSGLQPYVLRCNPMCSGVQAYV